MPSKAAAAIVAIVEAPSITAEAADVITLVAFADVEVTLLDRPDTDPGCTTWLGTILTGCAEILEEVPVFDSRPDIFACTTGLGTILTGCAAILEDVPVFDRPDIACCVTCSAAKLFVVVTETAVMFGLVTTVIRGAAVLEGPPEIICAGILALNGRSSCCKCAANKALKSASLGSAMVVAGETCGSLFLATTIDGSRVGAVAIKLCTATANLGGARLVRRPRDERRRTDTSSSCDAKVMVTPAGAAGVILFIISMSTA